MWGSHRGTLTESKAPVTSRGPSFTGVQRRPSGEANPCRFEPAGAAHGLEALLRGGGRVGVEEDAEVVALVALDEDVVPERVPSNSTSPSSGCSKRMPSRLTARLVVWLAAPSA